MMMPALPGAHLVRVHPRFTLAAFETGLNTGSRFDDSRQFYERGRRQFRFRHPYRTEVVTITIVSVLIGGIRRDVRVSESGRRVTTSHSLDPVHLCSSRVCTRRVTISMYH